MFPACAFSYRSIAVATRMFHRSCTACQKENVDKNEVENFSKLSEDWWNPNGKMKPLLSMNDLRVPFVRDGLINTKIIDEDKAKTSKYLDGLKILDVGCGGGFYSVPLARLGADVTGIDPTPSLIQVATAYVEKNLPNAKIKFESTTIEEHASTKNNYYDALVCSEVIEHVSAKESFIKSCSASVKPGGSLFFTTISQTFLAWLLAIVVAENVIRMPPKGTHQYEKLIAPADLSCLLEGAKKVSFADSDVDDPENEVRVPSNPEASSFEESTAETVDLSSHNEAVSRNMSCKGKRNPCCTPMNIGKNCCTSKGYCTGDGANPCCTNGLCGCLCSLKRCCTNCISDELKSCCDKSRNCCVKVCLTKNKEDGCCLKESTPGAKCCRSFESGKCFNNLVDNACCKTENIENVCCQENKNAAEVCAKCWCCTDKFACCSKIEKDSCCKDGGSIKLCCQPIAASGKIRENNCCSGSFSKSVKNYKECCKVKVCCQEKEGTGRLCNPKCVCCEVSMGYSKCLCCKVAVNPATFKDCCQTTEGTAQCCRKGCPCCNVRINCCSKSEDGCCKKGCLNYEFSYKACCRSSCCNQLSNSFGRCNVACLLELGDAENFTLGKSKCCKQSKSRCSPSCCRKIAMSCCNCCYSTGSVTPCCKVSAVEKACCQITSAAEVFTTRCSCCDVFGCCSKKDNTCCQMRAEKLCCLKVASDGCCQNSSIACRKANPRKANIVSCSGKCTNCNNCCLRKFKCCDSFSECCSSENGRKTCKEMCRGCDSSSSCCSDCKGGACVNGKCTSEDSVLEKREDGADPGNIAPELSEDDVTDAKGV